MLPTWKLAVFGDGRLLCPDAVCSLPICTGPQHSQTCKLRNALTAVMWSLFGKLEALEQRSVSIGLAPLVAVASYVISCCPDPPFCSLKDGCCQKGKRCAVATKTFVTDNACPHAMYSKYIFSIGQTRNSINNLDATQHITLEVSLVALSQVLVDSPSCSPFALQRLPLRRKMLCLHWVYTPFAMAIL